MNKKYYSGDPSEIVQSFPKFNLELLCCRLWWLKNWEHKELSYPFWRIYYNRQEGASIISNGSIIDLKPNRIYLITPNTSYASKLFDHNIPRFGHKVSGGRIAIIRPEERKLISTHQAIEHLFIHFTIGFPYDTIAPKIYSFEINKHFEDMLGKIYIDCHEDRRNIDIHMYLILQTLISEMLLKIDTHHWEQITKDDRISRVINYIEQNITGDLSNKKLADVACMARNSFSFLFKKEANISVQQFIKRKRINTACMMLLHSELSIDEIAEATGFSNRYHFTRVFKDITKTSPGHYRKEYILSPHMLI